MKGDAEAFARTVTHSIREAKAAGATSIAAALNAHGIATTRGGRWEAQTVANVLRSVGL